jgi:hypothetical protein
MRPAGFWRRYAAYSLDITVVLGLALPLAWPRLAEAGAVLDSGLLAVQLRLWELFDLALASGRDPLGDLLGLARDPGLRGLLLDLARALGAIAFDVGAMVVAVSAAWFIATEASGWQASPGKRALGLRVVAADGGAPGLGRVMARFAAGLPSWLLLHLGHAMAAWPPERRALHDRIAGTRVVLADDAPAAMPGWARAWLALQLLVFALALGWILLAYAMLAWTAFGG